MSGEKRRICCKLCFMTGKKDHECIVSMHAFKKHLERIHGDKYDPKMKGFADCSEFYGLLCSDNKINKLYLIQKHFNIKNQHYKHANHTLKVLMSWHEFWHFLKIAGMVLGQSVQNLSAC